MHANLRFRLSLALGTALAGPFASATRPPTPGSCEIAASPHVAIQDLYPEMPADVLSRFTWAPDSDTARREYWRGTPHAPSLTGKLSLHVWRDLTADPSPGRFAIQVNLRTRPERDAFLARIHALGFDLLLDYCDPSVAHAWCTRPDQIETGARFLRAILDRAERGELTFD